MTLGETSLRILVGLRSPAPITAGVVLHGQEVIAVRPVAVGRWAAEGSAVAATVSFGPFDHPVSFDAVRLYHGGEQLQDLPRRSVMNLDPGDVFSEPVFLSGTNG
jgi:hypothetical protein